MLLETFKVESWLLDISKNLKSSLSFNSIFPILLLLKFRFVRFNPEMSIDSKLLSEISIIFNLELYNNSIPDNKLSFKFSFSRS